MPAVASIHIQPKDLMERWQLPSYTSENYKKLFGFYFGFS